MKKIYIITLFLLSCSVLAHTPLNNDFESMMKRMFNHMEMMDMHHNHWFEEMGLRNNNNSWLSLNQIKNKDNFQLKIILEGMDKEDLKIHIDKNLLVIKAEKNTISETGQSSQSFVQKFMIPKDVNKSKITADFREGELIVTMPKNVKSEPEIQQITIN
jgi:HSP20 family protein